MFKRIFLPFDNSQYAWAAAEVAIRLAGQSAGRIVGCHVYAADLHQNRFQQMEAGLPEPYRRQEVLERQRQVHAELIGKGLGLISRSYLSRLETRCQEARIPFEGKSIRGRHFQVLVEEVRRGQYDLVVMGAQGLGAVTVGNLGSVVERVLRRIDTDMLVVRDDGFLKGRGRIVAGIDGSHWSFGGLHAALTLGKAFGLLVEAVAVYDPYFHVAVFKQLTEVLTEEAGRMFHFKEQERLHTEVIDKGLAKVYQEHLEKARFLAEAEGATLHTRLLAGKTQETLAEYLRAEPASLLVLGRIGYHSDAILDLGSTPEDLLRRVPCSVYLGARSGVDPEANACRAAEHLEGDEDGRGR